MQNVRITTLAFVITGISVHFPVIASAQADFEGIWNAQHPPRMGQPPPDEVRLTPAGQAEYDNFSLDKDPTLRCLMPGIPLGLVDPYPLEIVQQDHQVLFLYEHFHQVRRIFTDGREAPDHWLPSLIGYSTGHWDGDTLVVDVIHFTDQTWFDRSGNFHSPSLHVVERYTRTGPDHMRYEVTIEDPEVFTEPWQMSMPLYRRVEENIRVLEYECYALAEDQAVE